MGNPSAGTGSHVARSLASSLVLPSRALSGDLIVHWSGEGACGSHWDYGRELIGKGKLLSWPCHV